VDITPGDPVVVRTATGTELQRVATTEPVMGHDFVVVWVSTPEEWQAAKASGAEPEAFPWPVEDVRLLEQV
jgi:hypothetical protein